jgi:predicted amidohydrolase
MSDLKTSLQIALVQAKQVWEDKESNLLHFSTLLNDVSGTDLILLPEMFNTGFSMNSNKLAETMENSKSLDWLTSTAKSKNSAIYTSLIIKDGDRYFNRGVFVDPNGQLHIYNKRKTFGLAGEDKQYSSGEEEVVVELFGWRMQLQICYDLRFPEIVRNRLLSDGTAAYDLILYVANWPERRRLHWQSLLRARAIENQSYVVGVNRVGQDGNGLSYAGDSVCVDALGIEENLTPFKEEVRIVTVSKEALLQARTALPFLKDI